MALIVSTRVSQKLADKIPPVTRNEVEQCFANRTGVYLYDTREEHVSDPPTRWFIAQTDFGRKLKVVFIPKHGNIYLRTAFEPNGTEVALYLKHGKP